MFLTCLTRGIMCGSCKIGFDFLIMSTWSPIIENTKTVSKNIEKKKTVCDAQRKLLIGTWNQINEMPWIRWYGKRIDECSLFRRQRFADILWFSQKHLSELLTTFLRQFRLTQNAIHLPECINILSLLRCDWLRTFYCMHKTLKHTYQLSPLNSRLSLNLWRWYSWCQWCYFFEY